MNEPVRASFIVPGLSREEVFAALLDVERFLEWAFGLVEARLLGPPSALARGSTIEFHLGAAGMRHKVKSAVTAVEPPRRLEWRYVKGAKGIGGWILEDLGGGAVGMTLHTSYEVRPAWLDRLANRPPVLQGPRGEPAAALHTPLCGEARQHLGLPAFAPVTSRRCTIPRDNRRYGMSNGRLPRLKTPGRSAEAPTSY